MFNDIINLATTCFTDSPGKYFIDFMGLRSPRGPQSAQSPQGPQSLLRLNSFHLRGHTVGLHPDS